MNIYLAGTTGLTEKERERLYGKKIHSVLLSYWLIIDNLFDHKKATLWCLQYNKKIKNENS